MKRIKLTELFHSLDDIRINRLTDFVEYIRKNPKKTGFVFEFTDKSGIDYKFSYTPRMKESKYIYGYKYGKSVYESKYFHDVIKNIRETYNKLNGIEIIQMKEIKNEKKWTSRHNKRRTIKRR